MRTLIFAPAFYNLAETTRAVEIAKASRHHFDCRFISYGGQFEDVVRKEGFEIQPMDPQLTPDLIDHIYAVDKGEKRGDIMPVDVLEQRVANEIELWQAEQPAAALTGWSLGDYSLIADVPEFAGLEAGPNQHFIGPLIGRLDAPIPEDQPIVYFAMGSSGTAGIIADIMPVFAGQPYRVISPIKSLVEGLDGRCPTYEVPANVIVTDWLPAHEVNPMADISVIHGGIGTVMTACLSGTPVVGVGMQPEQEANLDCLVRAGCAIRLSKRRVTAEAVANAIDDLLGDAEAKRQAKEFQAILQRWGNGGTNAAQFLVETL
ncbi:MAG: PGL/p-HBAD biosynthesis glycosyltransferase [Anaerolineales bacterium]|nr:PGL/p-HBAD biosynthesis glycosyltransferase [Anaerolineales bacterium]